jgi:hypothetical protein
VITPSDNPINGVREYSLRGFRILRLAAWAVMLLIGFIIAATGYRHGLPFIDLPDEVTIWTMGRSTIDPNWPRFQPEYPPGLPLISATIQSIQQSLGDPYINPAGTVEVMRLTSVLAYVVVLALIMRLTYRMAESSVSPPLALIGSLSAGVLWMALPLAVYQSRFATVDTWVTMWFMGAIVAGVESWRVGSTRWLLAALILSLVAATFKWQGGAALAFTALLWIRFYRSNRRYALRLLALTAIIVAFYGFWAVFIDGALKGGTYLPGTEIQPPSLASVLVNMQYSLFHIGSGWLYAGLGVLAIFWSLLSAGQRRHYYEEMPGWGFGLVFVAFHIMLSLNGAPVFDRHYLGIMAVLAVVSGLGIVLSLDAITTKRIPLIRARGLRLLASVVLILLVGWSLWPMVQTIRRFTLEMLPPDRRVTLADWANATVTQGGIMVTDPNLAFALDPTYGYRGHRLQTPEWGAYIGLESLTAEKVQANDVRYLVANPDTDFSFLKLPLVPLISYAHDRTMRGAEWTAYYVGQLPVWQPDHFITFGETIQLRGYERSAVQICPGASITTQFLWGAIKPPERYYVYFLHLFSDTTGEYSAPLNGEQPVGENRPTISWTNASELLVGQPVTWQIPDDVAPGDYQLWLGIFDPISGDRLYLPDGKHYHVVDDIRVVPCFK